MPSQDGYRYALLIDICYRIPMFGKYSLHNLHILSMQSHFLTLCLKWSLKFSGKTDHDWGDLQFKILRPVFTVFFFLSQTLEDFSIHLLFLLSNIKSIIGGFNLIEGFNQSLDVCFYGDNKCHYCFVAVYQSHLCLVLISYPAYEFC